MVSNIVYVHNIWDNPSHWLIFFKMVIAPPTSDVLEWCFIMDNDWRKVLTCTWAICVRTVMLPWNSYCRRMIAELTPVPHIPDNGKTASSWVNALVLNFSVRCTAEPKIAVFIPRFCQFLESCSVLTILYFCYASYDLQLSHLKLSQLTLSPTR